MSVPSVVALKDQANRLVTYLGDKHRFKLKLSSALEAMAAIHKQRDWNTLQAVAAAADSPMPTVANDEQFTLSWGSRGRAFLVSRDDWLRHTLATGGTTEDRRAWCIQQLFAQVARGGSGVFINAFGGNYPAESLTEMQSAMEVLDLGAAAGPEYNALRGLEPEAVAAMLAVLLPSGDPGSDFYKQTANYALTVLVGALQASQAPTPTLEVLVGLLSDRSGFGIRRLHERCPEGAARQFLAVFLEQYMDKDGRWQMRPDDLGGLADRLARLQTTSFARRLLSENPQAPGLLDLFAGPRCVVIEMANQDQPDAVATQGAVLLAGICALAASRLALSRESRCGVPQTVVLCEVQGYLKPALVRLTEQVRSVGTAILLTAPTEASLAPKYTGERILANTWNRLHLDGVPQEQAAALLERLTAAQQVLVSPTTVQF